MQDKVIQMIALIYFLLFCISIQPYLIANSKANDAFLFACVSCARSDSLERKEDSDVMANNLLILLRHLQFLKEFCEELPSKH